MTTWNPLDTAPNNKTVVILYRDAFGIHKARAKRLRGATSWHNPTTGIEITSNRFIDGWLSIEADVDQGIM